MRYAEGGGLTSKQRQAREWVRLEGGTPFERDVKTADIAAALRVGVRQARTAGTGRCRRRFVMSGSDRAAVAAGRHEVKVSDPSDRFEREAVSNADRVMSAPAGPAGACRAAVRTTVVPLCSERKRRPWGREKMAQTFVLREEEEEMA